MVQTNCNNIFQQPVSRHSFKTSLKAKARDQVYFDHAITFYCECNYTPNDRGSSGVIDPTNCGYEIKHIPSRGMRVEWEHVTPAATFGQHRETWSNHREYCSGGSKGRDCARKFDSEFRTMEADLHNLVPAIGELNADRSNLPFGIVAGEDRKYGECDFEVSDYRTEFKVVEPMDAVHGDIARIWLYMYMTYGEKALPTMHEQLEMFCEWLEKDHVSEWEVERNLRISNIQGNSNPYVDGSYKKCNEICGSFNSVSDEL